MNFDDYNKKAINDAYKNAHIAMQSISDILPQVKDEKMKKELNKEFNGYKKIIKKISTFMAQQKVQPEDVNLFKKMMLKASVKTKSIFNDSLNNIAEMMIKGTVLGITELTAMVNEKNNLSEEVSALIEELLALEETYEQDLKKFL